MNPTTGGEGKRSFDIDRTGGGRCRRASLSGNCAQRNYGGIADLAPSACLAKNGGGRCLESDGDRALRECRDRPSFVCISGWDLIRHCVAYKDSARPRVAADRRLTVNAGGDPSVSSTRLPVAAKCSVSRPDRHRGSSRPQRSRHAPLSHCAHAPAEPPLTGADTMRSGRRESWRIAASTRTGNPPRA
jgi:hypothetical protein